MKRLLLATVVLILVVAAQAADAAVVRRPARRARVTHVSEPSPVLGVVLRGGVASYSMNDMNDFLFASNVLNGTEFEEVDGGATFGAGVRVFVGPQGLVEFSYDRLTGESEDLSGIGDVRLDADLVMVSFVYLPPTYRQVRWGLGAGLGLVTSDAEARGPGGNGPIEGDGPAFHFFGLMDAPLGPNMSLTADLGFRYAVASDVDIIGVPSNVDLEWNGIVLRGGLAMYW